MSKGNLETGSVQGAEEWQFQLRINLSEEFAQKARKDLNDPALKPLKDILDKHGMTLKNQFDAFVGYCEEVEEVARSENLFKKSMSFFGLRKGPLDETLYKWTKDTISKPGKEKAYANRFTLYKGDAQIYPKDLADAVETELKTLKDTGMVVKVDKFNSNPAQNPQAPNKFR
jgi:hypothetical protein